MKDRQFYALMLMLKALFYAVIRGGNEETMERFKEADAAFKKTWPWENTDD